jgi:hypothetical protein
MNKMKSTQQQKRIPRNPLGNHKRTRHSHHSEWAKTLKNKDTLRYIFKDRINPLLGLTKQETISLYYGIPIKTVERYDKQDTDEAWKEILDVRKRLREVEVMAIIPVEMPIGTVLNDTGLPQSQGVRELDERKFIYHRCTDLNIAKAHKKKMIKCGEGFLKAGDQIEDITSKIIGELKVLNTLKN